MPLPVVARCCPLRPATAERWPQSLHCSGACIILPVMFRFSFADPAATAQHAAAEEPETGTTATAHEPVEEVSADEVRSAGSCGQNTPTLR